MKSNSTHVTGIAVIGIYVSDLKEAKSFYVHTLGLEDQGEMGPGCMLALGDTTFYLEPGRNKNLENQKLQDADITLCFSVESVKKAYAEMQQRNVPVVSYAEYSPEYAVLIIADPDGNVIELAGEP